MAITSRSRQHINFTGGFLFTKNLPPGRLLIQRHKLMALTETICVFGRLSREALCPTIVDSSERELGRSGAVKDRKAHVCADERGQPLSFVAGGKGTMAVAV